MLYVSEDIDWTVEKMLFPWRPSAPLVCHVVVECAPFPPSKSNHLELALCWKTIKAAYLPLEAVGARGVASFQEASGGGPAGWVLPWWWLFRLDPWLATAKWPIDGHQGGVAAAPDVKGHIWETGKTAMVLQQLFSPLTLGYTLVETISLHFF